MIINQEQNDSRIGWRTPNVRQATFQVGDAVKLAGTYVCVPCGYKKFFKEGQVFPRCFACMKKSKYNDDDFFHDLELWELIKES